MKSVINIPIYFLMILITLSSEAQVAIPPTHLGVDSLSLLATWKAPEKIILEEDFEEGSVPDGWNRSSSGQGWDTATSAMMGFIEINSHSVFMLTNDGELDSGNNGCCDYLITPVLDLTGYPGYKLCFDHYFTGNYKQKAYVEMSTDGGQNWIQLKSLDHYPIWRNETIDLSTLSGPGGLSSVRFAFHADDQGRIASGWAVDNVKVISDSLGVQGYYVYLNMVYMGQTQDTSFQLPPPLTYRQNYNLKISSIFSSGVSPQAMHTFTSLYLPPIESLIATAFTDFVQFSWNPPVGSTTVDHYNLYVDDTLLASLPSSQTDYSVPFENGELCLEVCCVHNLASFGYPCQFGESLGITACGFVDSSFELPLEEFWDSGQFSTNHWTIESGWDIDLTIGTEAPSAVFPVPLTPGEYSGALTSWYYDVSYLSPCYGGGIIFIFLDFQLLVQSDGPDDQNKFQIQLITEDGMTILKEYSNDGSTNWKSFHRDLLYHVAGHNFRIRFVALGNSDSSPVVWFLDNIQLHWAISDATSSFAIHAQRTGSPENNILVSWDMMYPNLITFILDDNSSEDSDGCDQAGEQWLGNKFPTGFCGILQEVTLFMSHVQNSSAIYSVDFFDENRSLIGSSATFTPLSNQWQNIYLPDIPFNDIFYAMLHIVADGPSDRLAIDTTGPNAPYDFAWKIDSTGWSLLPHSGVFLLRVKALVEGDQKTITDNYPPYLECDTIGYSIFRKAYTSYPPGGNSGTAEYEWIGCTPANVQQYLDKDLGNELTNCYEYSVAVFYPDHEGFPYGSAWDCIFVNSPEFRENQSLNFYPNPANDRLTFELHRIVGVLRLYDPFGRLILQRDVSGKEQYTLNTSGLPGGIYLVKIQLSDGLVQTEKIVIVN